MAQRIHRVDVLAPRESPLPFETTERIDFPPGAVTAITVEIPAGHHNLTGLRIWYNDVVLIPKTGGAYVRGNHRRTRYEFDDPFPGGTGWFVGYFNADKFYDHTFHLSVEIDETADALAALLPPVILLRQAGAGVAAEDGGTVTPIPGAGPIQQE